MRYCFITWIILISFDVSAQISKPKEKTHIQNGFYICILNNYIIYSTTGEEGEYPLHDLYSLDQRTEKKVLISSGIQSNCWVKTSDSTLLFSKSNIIYLWNSNTHRSRTFSQLNSAKKIIAVGFNNHSKKAIVFDLDQNVLTLSIFDEFKNNIFRQKIEYNKIEIEGILPKIESIERYFVFSIQDNLFFLDVFTNKPVLKIISDRVDGFALFEDQGIIIYKFISDEKTTGSIFSLKSCKIDTIDTSLNEKIFNCSRSNLITAQINGKFEPLYIICDQQFTFSETKWHILPDAEIYKDHQLIIQLLNKESPDTDDSFIWRRLNLSD